MFIWAAIGAVKPIAAIDRALGSVSFAVHYIDNCAGFRGREYDGGCYVITTGR